MILSSCNVKSLCRPEIPAAGRIEELGFIGRSGSFWCLVGFTKNSGNLVNLSDANCMHVRRKEGNGKTQTLTWSPFMTHNSLPDTRLTPGMSLFSGGLGRDAVSNLVLLELWWMGKVGQMPECLWVGTPPTEPLTYTSYYHFHTLTYPTFVILLLQQPYQTLIHLCQLTQTLPRVHTILNSLKYPDACAHV